MDKLPRAIVWDQRVLTECTRKLRHFDAMEKALREIQRNRDASKDYPGMDWSAKVAWLGAGNIADAALAVYDEDKQ